MAILKEFLEAGEASLSAGRLTVAGVNFAKAFFMAVDLMIVQKIGIRPENHTKRFDVVRFRFPELTLTLEQTFGFYRGTYNRKLTLEQVNFLKEVAYSVAKKTGFTEKFSE